MTKYRIFMGSQNPKDRVQEPFEAYPKQMVIDAMNSLLYRVWDDEPAPWPGYSAGPWFRTEPQHPDPIAIAVDRETEAKAIEAARAYASIEEANAVDRGLKWDPDFVRRHAPGAIWSAADAAAENLASKNWTEHQWDNWLKYGDPEPQTVAQNRINADLDRQSAKQELDAPFFCEGCGSVLRGVYASLGGNWVPFIRAKMYHLECVPKVSRLQHGGDDFDKRPFPARWSAKDFPVSAVFARTVAADTALKTTPQLELQMQINREMWAGVRCWRCGERFVGANYDCGCRQQGSKTNQNSTEV